MLQVQNLPCICVVCACVLPAPPVSACVCWNCIYSHMAGTVAQLVAAYYTTASHPALCCESFNSRVPSSHSVVLLLLSACSWKEFDAELEAAWLRVIHAMLLGDKPLAAQAILSYAYYWYNFMPLARGTAAVGYTTMLGLFWAAGIPITQPIPQDYQVSRAQCCLWCLWVSRLVVSINHAHHPGQIVGQPSEAVGCQPD